MAHKIKLKKIPVNGKSDIDIYPPTHRSYPPQFDVDDMQMPEIKDWEVGHKYRLIIDIEQTSKNENEDRVSGNFNIIAYKYLKPKTIEEMTDKEFGEYSGESLARGSL